MGEEARGVELLLLTSGREPSLVAMEIACVSAMAGWELLTWSPTGRAAQDPELQEQALGQRWHPCFLRCRFAETEQPGGGGCAAGGTSALEIALGRCVLTRAA